MVPTLVVSTVTASVSALGPYPALLPLRSTGVGTVGTSHSTTVKCEVYHVDASGERTVADNASYQSFCGLVTLGC